MMNKTNKAQITRNQHYIPQLILRRFCHRPNYCYTLNCNGNISEENIKTLCCGEDLYEFSNSINVPLNIVENAFRTEESHMGDILNKIDESKSTTASIDLLSQNHDYISYFSWLLIIRNKKILPCITEVNKELGYVKNSSICDNDLNILSMLDASKRYEDFKKSSTILAIDDTINKNFITSNIPFTILYHSQNISVFAVVLTPNILNILTSYHGYSGREMKQCLIYKDESFIKYINKSISSQNYKYLIAKTKEDLIEYGDYIC